MCIKRLYGRATDVRSRGPGFETTCCCFETWAISFTPLCPCLSEETLKCVGPFYLVSMPGEVKDPLTGIVWPAVESIAHEPLQKRPQRGSVNSANYVA